MSTKKNILTFLVLIVAVIAVISSIFFYEKSKETKILSAQEQTAGLVNKVGALIQLPTGENPQIATVSDKSKLSDQPFFKNAQNGDRVLIYSKAAKAILYRPSINKIIEVAPVNLGSSATNTKMYKVEVYNGSKTAGLAKTTAQSLSSQFSNVQIVGTANSSVDYQKSIVVDLKGSGDPFGQQLAKAVNGSVSSLPVGETGPTGADFLVIVGSK